MAEPESIRDIAHGLVQKYRNKQERRSQMDTTEEAIVLNEIIMTALENLHPVDPHALTGTDKMLLEAMGINPWD